MRSYVPIVVIGATNQVDSLDIGLRRAGRFDQEIPIGIPDDKQRKKILEILCKKIKLSTDIDIDKIVMNTPGYVGADLNALIDEALISSLDRRLIEQMAIENKDHFIINCIIIFTTICKVQHDSHLFVLCFNSSNRLDKKET
jgi:ATP-dependent 26S proteasome regulatory subunit